MAQFQFIEDKTREFLTSGRLKRVYFDITNLVTLSGSVGEGRFAFVELKLILDTDSLFRITSFYKDGKNAIALSCFGLFFQGFSQFVARFGHLSVRVL